MCPQLFDRLLRIGGFAKGGTAELLGQQHAQATADNRVVVDDEDPDRRDVSGTFEGPRREVPAGRTRQRR